MPDPREQASGDTCRHGTRYIHYSTRYMDEGMCLKCLDRDGRLSPLGKDILSMIEAADAMPNPWFPDA